MPKVICKLENASALINGIAFAPHPDGAEFGMVSEEIAQEHADHFCSIPGYELVGAPDKEITDLRAQAEALGVRVKGNWKADRLRQEIKAAQDEQAAKSAAGEQPPAI